MNANEAYSRATALCSKSEKCVSDIRKKLYDWQIEIENHNAILDALVENRYIDEERFTRYFVRDKYRFNGWGKVKIRHQLSQKQIPNYLIEQAFAEIDVEDYSEKLVSILHTKNRSIKTEDKYERRNKLMRFAAGRGFSLDEIQRALGNLLNE